jgi:hypothetical protein
MADTDTKEAEAPEVEEVPWDEKDVDLLALGLQRVGPYFLGNDVRSPESARGVALQLLQLFLDMGYEQPKPGPDFNEYVKSATMPYMDALQQQRSGNARTPPTLPEASPTPTEQTANARRKADASADEGKSAAEQRAERLK